MTKPQKCHKCKNCDIVTFGNVTKCHTFSNLWYKATLTFYVWIRLGTTLTEPLRAGLQSRKQKQSSLSVMLFRISFIPNHFNRNRNRNRFVPVTIESVTICDICDQNMTKPVLLKN